MPRYTVRLHRALRETTTFKVEAEAPSGIKERFEELFLAVRAEERVSYDSGDQVESVAEDIEVYSPDHRCVLAFDREACRADAEADSGDPGTAGSKPDE